MIINRFLNKPVSSNAYILQEEGNPNCIVIDPGSKNPCDMDFFIKKHNLYPRYVILTHEHFDHVWGTNRLVDEFGAEVVCSKFATKRLSEPLNYFNLLYFSDSASFSIDNVNHEVSDNDEILFGDEKIRFVHTPGHSPGSMCILCGDKLFSGDTLINGVKPHFDKKVGSSRKEWDVSVRRLLQYFPDVDVYPGHGLTFAMKDWKNFYLSLNIEATMHE